MQAKTMMRYHLEFIRMALIKKTGNMCWQRYGKKGTLIHCWWEHKLVQQCGKQYGDSSKKLKIEL